MNKLNKEICSLLKAEMKSSGLTYRDLALKINTPEFKLTRYLNQHSPFPITTAFELAKVLGMPLSKLVAEAEHRARVTHGNTTKMPC